VFTVGIAVVWCEDISAKSVQGRTDSANGTSKH
jgi:hypothetical protein